MNAPAGIADGRALRRAFGRFPTGVCVTTAFVDGVRIGMTMSSFGALSLDPPLVTFAIDRRAAGLPMWERAAGYAINVLAANQGRISDRFASAGANKFEGLSIRDGLQGAPVLPGTAATFECSAFEVVDGGDHRLFLARIERFSAEPDRAPLVFAGGRYAQLHSGEAAAPLWPLDIHYY